MKLIINPEARSYCTLLAEATPLLLFGFHFFEIDSSFVNYEAAEHYRNIMNHDPMAHLSGQDLYCLPPEPRWGMTCISLRDIVGVSDIAAMNAVYKPEFAGLAVIRLTEGPPLCVKTHVTEAIATIYGASEMPFFNLIRAVN